jgi:DNA-directed RNA polymerase specialized sigma24 family protein
MPRRFHLPWMDPTLAAEELKFLLGKADLGPEFREAVERRRFRLFGCLKTPRYEERRDGFQDACEHLMRVMLSYPTDGYGPSPLDYGDIVELRSQYLHDADEGAAATLISWLTTVLKHAHDLHRRWQANVKGDGPWIIYAEGVISKDRKLPPVGVGCDWPFLPQDDERVSEEPAAPESMALTLALRRVDEAPLLLAQAAGFTVQEIAEGQGLSNRTCERRLQEAKPPSARNTLLSIQGSTASPHNARSAPSTPRRLRRFTHAAA